MKSYYYYQELYHHGVAGQRWGKRHGPPYPLGKSQVSAAEKKAGWKESAWANGSKAAKAVGRGVKATAKGSVVAGKAIGRGIKKTANVTNKVLLRLNKKPRVLMSDQEIIDQYNRLKLQANYKRALKGKFTDISEDQRKQGDSIKSQLMKSLGKDVLVPAIVGRINYELASRVAMKTEDKAPSMVETMFGKNVRFRDGERYVSKDIKEITNNALKNADWASLNNLYNKKYSNYKLVPDERKQGKNGKKNKGSDTDISKELKELTEAIKGMQSQGLNSEKSKKKKKNKKQKSDEDGIVDNVMDTPINSTRSTDDEEYSRFLNTLMQTDAISNTMDMPLDSIGTGSFGDNAERLRRMGRIV